jgi:thiol-disulfide isomerase/thioredoxin
MKLLILSCALMFQISVSAQTPYTTTGTGTSSILNGILTKYALINNEAAFPWYKSNSASYSPDSSLVNAMYTKPQVHFIIFGGTWCEDTQNIIPKFFRVQEQTGFPDNRITFYGVDRSKKTIGGIADALGITNVPTIIVMKDGKEIGRVIEYGKTGKWDSELAQLLK